jgi:hypothetical protein
MNSRFVPCPVIRRRHPEGFPLVFKRTKSTQKQAPKIERPLSA